MVTINSQSADFALIQDVCLIKRGPAALKSVSPLVVFSGWSVGFSSRRCLRRYCHLRRYPW